MVTRTRSWVAGVATARASVRPGSARPLRWQLGAAVAAAALALAGPRLAAAQPADAGVPGPMDAGAPASDAAPAGEAADAGAVTGDAGAAAAPDAAAPERPGSWNPTPIPDAGPEASPDASAAAADAGTSGDAGASTPGTDAGVTVSTPEPPPATSSARDADVLPISWALHGYYRARLVWAGNIPGRRGLDNRNAALDARYAFMRLRLEPELTYGTNPSSPVARLRMQVDGLDNVVFGDNARVTRTPIFAADPSATDIEGFDIGDTLRLKRVWLEVMVPFGQLRVGRMPSQWGYGILTTDGDGLGEWGDPLFGSTFDRILFATRPITIYRALSRNDARPTPLIFALAYDKLVDHPVVRSVDPPPGTATTAADITLGPFATTYDERPATPFAFLSGEEDDVSSITTAVVWNDPDFGNREPDELTAGAYYVYRWQDFLPGDVPGLCPTHGPDGFCPNRPRTKANQVFIWDLFWRYRHTLTASMPQLFVEGELLNIRGHSRTVSLTGGCDDTTGLCRRGTANIFGLIARAGFRDQQDRWTAWLEGGYASGDGRIFGDDELTVRPLHPDYHVGLVMYQMALAALTAIELGESVRPLWSRGGVWNSKYLWPQVRYTLIPGVEVHGALLLAWADQLVGPIYVNERADFTDSECGAFEGDCFLGFEVDAALRIKWGVNDLLHWDTELGFMRAGDALYGQTTGLKSRFLYTVQTRLGIVF